MECRNFLSAGFVHRYLCTPLPYGLGGNNVCPGLKKLKVISNLADRFYELPCHQRVSRGGA